VKLAARGIEEDVRRVRALREAIGPGVLLRGDANRGWTWEAALRALPRLEPFGFDFIEEPVAERMSELRERTGIPLACDESAADLERARRIVRERAADLLVVKPMAIGGPAAAAQLAIEALAAGLRVIVTSILETPIGIAGALHVAAVLPGREIHGVATAHLLSSAPVEGWSEPERGDVPLPPGPGLGVRLSPSVYAKRRP
jgi:L-alanine-DL-glutamate epimerase-like enolase superfamily enzyme